MSLTVYTCCFGYTDKLHEPAVKGDARFVCFTDLPNLKSNKWEIVEAPPQPTPTRSSRMTKALSHLHCDTEWSLWQDCNFSLRVDPMSLLRHGEFVNFLHRDRKRINDEAGEIVKIGKAKPEAIAIQLATYHADGFDTDENPQRELSCNGVILRRHTPEVIALNELWAKQLERHTLRDQMSLDYCAWKLGVKFSRWPGVHTDNPYFKYQHYRRPTNDY